MWALLLHYPRTVKQGELRDQVSGHGAQWKQVRGMGEELREKGRWGSKSQNGDGDSHVFSLASQRRS